MRLSRNQGNRQAKILQFVQFNWWLWNNLEKTFLWCSSCYCWKIFAGIQDFNYLIFHHLFLKRNSSVMELNEHRPSRLLQLFLWWQLYPWPALYIESALPAPFIWTLGLCAEEYFGVLVEQKVTVIHSLRGLMQQNIKKARPGISFNVKVKQMCHNPCLTDITLKTVHSLKNHECFPDGSPKTFCNSTL